MKRYPDHVIVAGGGRWARVLTSVLCGLLPRSATVTIYSPHCADSMAKWAKEQNLHDRVSSSSTWPVVSPDQSHAMVVANAARDHYRTTKKALANRIPVLVEKPVALSFSDAQRLAKTSQENCIRLAPAHVFLFASYLGQFSELVSNAGKISSVRVCWSDPKSEHRYGEKKYFDPTLPVYADWMPHVLSILSEFVPTHLCECEQVRFFRGGAQLNLTLRLGEVLCEVELLRNGDSRRRMVEVETDSENFRLDFSTEPGTVSCSSCLLSEEIDYAWEADGKPVARMLDAFLTWAADDNAYDKRLDIELGLHVSKLIDQIKFQYQRLQREWLLLALSNFDSTDVNLQYGLGELLQLSRAVSSERLIDMMEKIGAVLASDERFLWLEELEKTDDYGTFIRETVA